MASATVGAARHHMRESPSAAMHQAGAHQTPDTSCVVTSVPKVGRLPTGVSRSYTSAAEMMEEAAA